MFKNTFQIKDKEDLTERITAGDCLRRRREENNLSLKEISEELGIKNEYLENLENGNYKDLPPQVYVRGFIRSYAGLLGIDGGQLIKIYNREMSFLGGDKDAKKEEKSAKVDFRDYLIVTPKILTIAISLFIVSVLGYYFYRQVNSFNSKPYLFVESPASDEVVKEKDLWVKGKTESDAILKINGQDISVNNKGDFNEKITLSEGRNLLVIEARNRFNKTDKKEINIVYENPEEENRTLTETPAETNSDINSDPAAASDNQESKNATGDKSTAASSASTSKENKNTSANSSDTSSLPVKNSTVGTSSSSSKDTVSTKNTLGDGGSITEDLSPENSETIDQ